MDQIRLNPNLSVDRSIYDFLVNTNHIICRIIVNGDTTPGINYLSPGEKSEMISFLPEGKEVLETPFRQKGRISMRVGKIVSKLIPNHYIERFGINNSSIEAFVNSYKAWFDYSKLTFKLIQGEEIRKWYLGDNYMTPGGECIGTLWKSCMRHKRRQPLLKLYCDNPSIKMLIVTSEEFGEEKLRARAILWDDVQVMSNQDTLPEKIKVMDRIYSVYDSDFRLLKKWAEQNDYIPKLEQNATSQQLFDVKGNLTKIKCRIQLEHFQYELYPFLDTFPYFDSKKGIISNSEYDSTWDAVLNDPNGLIHNQEDDYEESFFDNDY